MFAFLKCLLVLTTSLFSISEHVKLTYYLPAVAWVSMFVGRKIKENTFAKIHQYFRLRSQAGEKKKKLASSHNFYHFLQKLDIRIFMDNIFVLNHYYYKISLFRIFKENCQSMGSHFFFKKTV